MAVTMVLVVLLVLLVDPYLVVEAPLLLVAVVEEAVQLPVHSVVAVQPSVHSVGQLSLHLLETDMAVTMALVVLWVSVEELDLLDAPLLLVVQPGVHSVLVHPLAHLVEQLSLHLLETDMAVTMALVVLWNPSFNYWQHWPIIPKKLILNG